MKLISSLEGGLTGALALTLTHEFIKRIDPKAPRMDLLGMNALSRLFPKKSRNASGSTLFYLTLAGDIIGNAAYYSLSGAGPRKKALLRGTLLGLAAGAGALVLPSQLGLNASYSNRSARTKWMTGALYLIGGIVAAGTISLLSKDTK